MALVQPRRRGRRLRLLIWNLFHGRSLPPAGCDLEGEFTAAIAGWAWDVALLQEVPPWWPPGLAQACGAEQRTALTSRNAGRVLRRVLARRAPDALKSNGGGANAVLARVPIECHRAVRLRTWPERRVAQLVRLAGGTVVAGYHASTRVPLAEQELARLWELARGLAAGAPVVVAGDLNLREPRAPQGAVHAAARDVDHVFALGMRAAGEAERMPQRTPVGGRDVALSDHVPLIVELT